MHMCSTNVHVTLGDAMRYCRQTFVSHYPSADGAKEEEEHIHIPHEFRVLTDRSVAALSVRDDELIDTSDNANIDISMNMDKEIGMDIDMDSDVNSTRTISF